MTDRHDTPRDADELKDAVADLGDTHEDQLETVAERNDSLQERKPSDDLPRAEGAAEKG